MGVPVAVARNTDPRGVLYKLFAKELPTFLLQIDLAESRSPLPAFVRRTLWSLLD